MLVEMNKVSKKYKSKLALRDVDLTIEAGRVVGLLGHNGSGKTTLIKLLEGFLKPSKGEIRIDGLPVGKKTKALVSYLPDSYFIPDDYKVSEALDLFEEFFQDFNRQKASELLGFMKLEEDMKVGSMSKGMKEKLHLTLILSREAKLYIIDEPISGVDLVTRDQILEAILSNIDEDKSMIITTHLVSDMERIFDDVAFLSDGEIVLYANAEDLRMDKNMQITDIYREIFG